MAHVKITSYVLGCTLLILGGLVTAVAGIEQAKAFAFVGIVAFIGGFKLLSMLK